MEVGRCGKIGIIDSCNTLYVVHGGHLISDVSHGVKTVLWSFYIIQRAQINSSISIIHPLRISNETKNLMNQIMFLDFSYQNKCPIKALATL